MQLYHLINPLLLCFAIHVKDILSTDKALRVESRTSDREVAGLTPARALLRNNLRQVVHAFIPVSPSSISWYR